MGTGGNAMRIRRAVLVTVVVAASAHAELRLEPVMDGFVQPVLVTAPLGVENRLWVLELRGTIREIVDGVLLDHFFLDIRDRAGDTGTVELLGMAFHPDYAENGLFFVNYVHTDGGVTMPRIARFATMQETPESPVVADPASETLFYTYDSLIGSHNGGSIAFGPNDGYLYIPTGDGAGGCCYDMFRQGQDLTVPRGKVLRIDVDQADPGLPYAIPPSNPFVDDDEALDEIWAYGLRNPFRSNFDRATGDLYIGDPGQDRREEICFQPASSLGGENYGWSIFEGTRCAVEFYAQDDCEALEAEVTFPIIEIAQPDAQTIIGGSVYRGAAIPCLNGTYFFGDFITQRIWSFRNEAGEAVEFQERTQELDPDGALLGSVIAISEDGAGELYVVNFEGAIFRIESDTPICRDGDVNQDCGVTPADALAAFQHFLQQPALSLCGQLHADVNDPQPVPNVTPADALCIFEHFLQRPSCLGEFPQECSCADG
jgi:glucose/arabinose dehydrogenase